MAWWYKTEYKYIPLCEGTKWLDIHGNTSLNSLGFPTCEKVTWYKAHVKYNWDLAGSTRTWYYSFYFLYYETPMDERIISAPPPDITKNSWMYVPNKIIDAENIIENLYYSLSEHVYSVGRRPWWTMYLPLEAWQWMSWWLVWDRTTLQWRCQKMGLLQRWLLQPGSDQNLHNVQRTLYIPLES